MSVTISGSGQIIKQVVQTSVPGLISFSGYSPGSWFSATGVSVSITPTNANNKIYVSFSAGTSTDANGLYNILLRVTRNGTAVGVGSARGSSVQCASSCGNPYSNYQVMQVWEYLDSPATTSTLTYQLQACSEQGIGAYLGGSQGSAAAYTASIPTTITVMEVAYA